MQAIIHPTAVIFDNVFLEEDVYVGPLCILGGPPEWKGRDDNKGVIIKKGTILTGMVTIDGGAERTTVIGENCYIMKHSYIAHDCIIGDQVTMSAGSKIAGYCTIEKKVVLGMGASIHQKCLVPEGVMIGMNGVVTKTSKLLPYSKYVGIPVKYLASNEKAKNNN